MLTKSAVTWLRLSDMGAGEAKHSSSRPSPSHGGGLSFQALTLLGEARFRGMLMGPEAFLEQTGVSAKLT